MGSKAIDVLGTIVLVGGLFVLTRPGSQGPGIVSSFFNGFGGVLGTAEGTIAPGQKLASGYAA